jgi:ABC-type transporter MlaC component
MLLLAALVCAATPVERTESLLAAFKDVRAPAADGVAVSPEDREANKKAFAALDQHIDFDAITTAAIAPHKGKLNATQMKHYKEVFTELIRQVSYPRSGRLLARAQVKVGTPKGNDVPVQLRVPDEDVEVNVTFHWAKDKLVDASFDGASLVKDYQNQFGRILEKEGAAGLLAKLDKRLEAERKTSVL